MFSNLFTFGIYSLVFVLVFCIVKTIIHTISKKKQKNDTCFQLQERIMIAQLMLQNNNEKIQLVEYLQKTLFNRFFKITRDIILMQKLIFETHVK